MAIRKASASTKASAAAKKADDKAVQNIEKVIKDDEITPETLEALKKKFEAQKESLKATKDQLRKDKNIIARSEKKQEALLERISKVSNAEVREFDRMTKRLKEMAEKEAELTEQLDELSPKAEVERKKINELEDKLLEARANNRSTPQAGTVKASRTRLIKSLAKKEWVVRYDENSAPLSAKKNGTGIVFGEEAAEMTTNGKTILLPYGKGATRTAQKAANATK